jgi:hypothetical protein
MRTPLWMSSSQLLALRSVELCSDLRWTANDPANDPEVSHLTKEVKF